MVENRVWEDLKNPEEEPKEQMKQQTYPFWHQSRDYKPCLTGGGRGGGGLPPVDPLLPQLLGRFFPFSFVGARGGIPPPGGGGGGGGGGASPQ